DLRRRCRVHAREPRAPDRRRLPPRPDGGGRVNPPAEAAGKDPLRTDLPLARNGVFPRVEEGAGLLHRLTGGEESMKPQNRVAIVTGAGQGIGRAIAEKLSEEGASVVVADINAETATKTAAEIGGTVHTVDVSSEEQVAGLVHETIGKHGKVDILVNNA